MNTLRLAVVSDYREEGWRSMDLVAEMLVEELRVDRASTIVPTPMCPPLPKRFRHLPGAGRTGFNADRLLGRFVDYPRMLRSQAPAFDLFHVCDHSYAHLALELPTGRTGVYCHDLDAFRCVVDPSSGDSRLWYRTLARRLVRGLRQAAVVFYNSVTVGRELEELGVVERDRLVHAPLGVAPEFTADGPRREGKYLLHVGSCIPRKRIDVLLDAFAEVRRHDPSLELIHAGGEWTSEQRGQLRRLGLGDVVRAMPELTREQLAEVYRGAALVLLPSEAEGFGLPVIEALACGAPVLASDLPVLREVGGEALAYRPVGDVRAWADTVIGMLDGRVDTPTPRARSERAARFSWSAHARTIAEAYERILEGEPARAEAV